MSDGVNDVVRDLRSAKELDEIPILVFAREAGSAVEGTEAMVDAADTDLVNFVEKQRSS